MQLPAAIMTSDYRSVRLDQIDTDDDTYRIDYGPATDKIKGSIQTVGLINAPVLLIRQNRFVIVCGFRRIAACRALGWTVLDARCLPADTPALRCALFAIADNAGQRTFNMVEMARAAALLVQAGIAECQQIQLLQSLGLALNTDLLAKLKQIPEMAAPLRQGLADGAIALPIALKLHALIEDAEIKLSVLFLELGLSLNRQRELLEWVEGISHRENIPIPQILEEGPLPQWRDDPELDRNLKTQLIRRYLKTRRYPEITAHEQRYARCVKDLKPGEGLQLIPPVHFEGRTYALRLDFKTPHELRALCGETQRIANSPALLTLLDL